jgi:hypothetical protein
MVEFFFAVSANQAQLPLLLPSLACRAVRAERPAALVAGLTAGYVRTQVCL